MFRTSDAFLIEKIILCGITPTPPNKDIRKSALGSTNSVDWDYENNTIDAVLKLKKNNYQIMNLKKFYFSLLFVFFAFSINAEELKNNNSSNAFNVYTGMFDFSDDGKSSTLIGFQHQNENLNRDTFLGNLSPITGGLFTADNAGYIYTGVQAQYKVGALNITPSFTPGLYHEGDGKDLGHMIEFKSEVQLSLNLSQNSELGFSYNHISNASIGDKNPGANSYMFNFIKNF